MHSEPTATPDVKRQRNELIIEQILESFLEQQRLMKLTPDGADAALAKSLRAFHKILQTPKAKDSQLVMG